MKKVAKLVYVSLVTRVVVDENATENQIIAAARPSLVEKLNPIDIIPNVTSIEDDTGTTYHPKYDKQSKAHSYLVKDKSGRGYIGEHNKKSLIKGFGKERNDYGITLRHWAEVAEVGDEFKNSTIVIIRTK